MTWSGRVATVVLALVCARPASALVGVIDPVPAATLLFPYFEVDLGSDVGVTTILSVRNAWAAPALANVTFWTNAGVPTVSFQIALAPYDVQTMNLRDVLVDGTIPITLDQGFPLCSGFLPYGNPFVTGAALTDLQAAHRGLEAPTWFGAGKCGGFDDGDMVARGYVTVDVVNECTLVRPGDTGYFVDGGVGVAANDNWLVGDFQLIDPANNFAQGAEAVHVEAGPSVASGGGVETFYAGLVGGSGADNREPLPTTWGASYETGDSELLVWRDTATRTDPFDCGTGPPWFPLNHNQIIYFDAESNPEGQPLDVPGLPRRAARATVGSGGLSPPAPRGWMYLNLNTTISGEAMPEKQAWVTVLHAPESAGLFGTASSAIPLGYPSGGGGGLGTPDVTPAATLLLPYFEAPLGDPSGPVTVARIGTFSADPVLVHVTLWSDLGVPTHAFDLYLGGYDELELDLRLLFAGIVPQTGPTLTNVGVFSLPPVAFPGCTGDLLAAGRLDDTVVADLRNAHTGKPVAGFGGLCAGADHGDDVARGYLTVDVVQACSLLSPDSPGYFGASGTGIAANDNYLWGESWFIDRANNFAAGEAMVHVEASNDPPWSSPGTYTFYGRHVNAVASDGRESLPTIWQGPYLNGGIFDGGTAVTVWRDAGQRTAFPCGSPPTGLRQREVTPFDEDGNNADLRLVPPPEFGRRLPLATERVDASDPSRLPIPFAFGFLHLDLNRPGSDSDPLFSTLNQGYATFTHRSIGRFETSTPGVAVDGLGLSFYPTP